MSGTTGFRFDDFEANVAEGVLRRGGFRVRLQDLPFRLLVALAERPGELVTRDELQKVLWPTESYGDFGHRLGGALNRLREALGDPADHPRVIETVPRRGYRFRATVERIDAPPVPTLDPTPEPAVTVPAPVVTAPAPRHRSRTVLAAAVLLAVTAGAWRVVPAAVEGDVRPGIAVLPFTDLTGPQQHMPYVVEASVRQAAGRLRVTVRLLEASSQAPLWSESFEGDAADPLALQARVAHEVAQAVKARAIPGGLTSGP